MLTRILKLAVFFIGGFALVASCSLGEIQEEKEDVSNTTVAEAQLTRADGNMLNLITKSLLWANGDRFSSKRVFFETRDDNPGCAVYCPPDFYPTSYYSEPYQGHYRVDPVYTGRIRLDPNTFEYWYRFYIEIKIIYQPYMLPSYFTCANIYYYDENDDPYENEYVQIRVC